MPCQSLALSVEKICHHLRNGFRLIVMGPVPGIRNNPQFSLAKMG